MKENLLLNTKTAEWLYETAAGSLPVIDYHNHLNVKELAENKNYENLARLWIIPDPYKHRAMRICGVKEEYITGDAKDYEKFAAWMDTLPKLIANPLYDWSILEMKRIFEIDLDPEHINCKLLWDTANDKLSRPEYTPREILNRFHVEYASPCATITEDISGYHSFGNLAPSLRADTITALTHETVEELEVLTQIPIETLEDCQRAIAKRLDAFEKAGCTFADHALDHGFCYVPDDGENERRFLRLCLQKNLTEKDSQHLSSALLRFLASCYAGKEWTMQLHIGAERYTSTRLRRLAGPAGGFAGIGSGCDVTSLTQMLDSFEQGNCGLPKIILYTLNPADNAVMSVLSGSYSQDGVAGKVQQGPAWWWCDHLHGMREVFETISSFGVLSAFVGMTTDSRSILSFVRHEYFRRAFCGWLGEKVEKGEITAPPAMLQELVLDVCYQNAKRRIKSVRNDLINIELDSAEADMGCRNEF